MRWNGQWFISEDYRDIYSGSDNGSNGGGIILIKKWAHYVKGQIAFHYRLIIIKLKSVPIDIAIIQEYITTS